MIEDTESGMGGSQAQQEQCYKNLLKLISDGCIDLSFDMGGGGDYNTTGPEDDLIQMVNMICPNNCYKGIVNAFTSSACKAVMGLSNDEAKDLEDQFDLAHDLLCIEVDGKLCVTEITDPFGQLWVDFDDEATINDVNLAKQCVPCFYAFMKNAIAATTVAEDEDAAQLGALQLALVTSVCMYDPVNDHYCFPYVADTPDCEAIGASPTCVDDVGDYVCDSTCHSRYLSVSYAFDTSHTQEEKDEFLLALDFLCTKNPTTSAYCAVEWMNEEQTRGSWPCATGGTGNFCTDCQTEVDALFTNLGCCYQSGVNVYLSTIDSEAKAASVQAWDEELRTDACNNDAPRVVDAACPSSTGPVSGAITMLTSLDCDYWKENTEEAEQALKEDFASSTGVPLSSVITFTVKCESDKKRAGSEPTLVGTGTVKSNQQQRTTLVQDTSNSFTADDWFVGAYSVKSGSYYAEKNAGLTFGPSVSSFLFIVITLIFALF